MVFHFCHACLLRVPSFRFLLPEEIRVMDYVNPVQLTETMIVAGGVKSRLSVAQCVLRGGLSGALLAIATSLSFTATAQGLPPIVGALIFPVGFVMIIILGLELATGNFAITPMALFRDARALPGVAKNLVLTYLGAVLGAGAYAMLFAGIQTQFHHAAPTAIGLLVNTAAEAKTLGYLKMGSVGWAVSFSKGILCNWMVCVGVMMGMSSRSTMGKVLACWLPILTFFGQGFEHSVVNMFVIPAGIMMGAKVSVHDWIVWNQIPVTLGNLVGAWALVTVPMYVMYGRSAVVAAAVPVASLETEEALRTA